MAARTRVCSHWGGPSHRGHATAAVAAYRWGMRTVTSCGGESPQSASTIESSPSHGAPPLQRPRRRRRLTYADRDRLLHCGSGIGADEPEIHASEEVTVGTAPRTIDPAVTAAVTRGVVAPAPRWRWSSPAGWGRGGLLRMLHVPVLGPLTFHLLQHLAYLKYGLGTVAFYSRSAPVGCGAPSMAPSIHRGFLEDHALPCIYVGSSGIHGRGLFTAQPLPRGTRVLFAPAVTLMDAGQYLLLLGDTFQRLPDSLHYTHPTGAIREVVMQARPQYLLNHSCERGGCGAGDTSHAVARVNLCCGLSKAFWPLVEEAMREVVAQEHASSTAGAGGEVVAYSVRQRECIRQLHHRIHTVAGFDDPNSFFTTCDVNAGEELCVDYGTRVAPTYHSEIAALLRPSKAQRLASVLSCHVNLPEAGGSLELRPCRCGAPQCRRYLYAYNPEALAVLRQRYDAVTRVPRADPSEADRQLLKQLLACGYDDETVLLSLLPRCRAAVGYLTHGENSSVAFSASLVRRTAPKKDLILSYRHVFKLLNEVSPQPHAAALSSMRSGGGGGVGGAEGQGW